MNRASVITDGLIFTQEEYDQLPYQSEFAARFGFRSFAAVPLTPLGPSLIFLSIERYKNQGMFSHNEIELLSRMLPHLRRAAQVALQLGHARDTGLLEGFELTIFVDAMQRGGAPGTLYVVLYLPPSNP